MKHTPIPFRLASRGDGNQQLPILDASGNIIAAVRDNGSLDDARFIVRAVNNFDALFEACTLFDEAMLECVFKATNGKALQDALSKARAAIAGAREER